MSASPRIPERTNGRSGEAAALLAAARAVLEKRAFADAAAAVLEASRSLLGAGAGIVALRAANGKGFEVARLEAGGLEVDAAAGLPAPLRRLASRLARTGRTVFANDLAQPAAATAAGLLSAPSNALLAPILLEGEVAGLLGLLDKPGGFSEADSQLAEVFAEMAAIALSGSRTVNGLERNRKSLQKEVRNGAAQLVQAGRQFETLVRSLPDVIVRFDPGLRYLYVSPEVERTTGRPARAFLGRTSQEAGVPPELVVARDEAVRRVFATGRPERLELSLPSRRGLRHFDCRLVPESGPEGTVASVLSVARDITDRRLAYDSERRARQVAEALREATVALTRSLDREAVLATLLDRLRGLVPFDRALVMLLEEASRVSVRALFDGDRVQALAPELRSAFDANAHPVLQGILTSGTAVLIPDLRAHPGWSLPADPESETSWMGVPLFARGDVAGLFSLSKREPGYFNEEHVKLAEALSSQASVAVENAILFEQMQAATVRMRLLSRRLVEVQENERRRIARELHDEAGQALASLRFGLRLLERELDTGRSGSERLTELVQRTDQVIDGLHRLAADLRPASLDHLGLEAALRQYARSAGSESGLAVRFKARGLADGRLPMVVETALYRVVQEAVTNVLRHARATRVDVLLERSDGRVLAMIEDNGVGFDPAGVRSSDCLGLVGLRERAEALGGTLTVESAPGAGTTVVVEVSSADPNPDR